MTEVVVSKEIEIIVKTPLRGNTEEHKLMAMDWVIEDMTKKGLQLRFLGWDHEDEEGFHHFKAVYESKTEEQVKKERSVTFDDADKSCSSCSS